MTDDRDARRVTRAQGVGSGAPPKLASGASLRAARHATDPQRLSLLALGASDLGLALTEHQLEQFQSYYEMLVDWNQRINLTAITEYADVQVKHFVDSLTVGAALLAELGPGANSPIKAPPSGFRIHDVGAGAGFPGVPLKILWPQAELVLSDSTGKKTAFLTELVHRLGLPGVEVLTARAEELGRDERQRETYDAVTARAVASLPVLCEYCLPLVRVGGVMLAPKKGDISQELRQGERAAGFLGGGKPELHAFRLPGEQEDRFVVAVRKLSRTSPDYPRRVGLAKAKPLG